MAALLPLALACSDEPQTVVGAGVSSLPPSEAKTTVAMEATSGPPLKAEAPAAVHPPLDIQAPREIVPKLLPKEPAKAGLQARIGPAERLMAVTSSAARYRAVDIRLNGALESGLRKAGVEKGPALAQVVKRVLIWWLNPRKDLRRGDRIRVVYEVPENSEPIAHAIWLDSARVGQKSAIRFKATEDRWPHWYDRKGSEVPLRLKHSPLRDYEQITSILGDGRRHRGMDFKTPVGTEILAPFNARVARRNWKTRRNGNCLHLKTAKGIDIFLLHLESIPDRIRPGLRVKRGEVVAFTGNTGRSFAPHLHYQLEKGGRVLDPLKIHDTLRRRLGENDKKRLEGAWTKWVRFVNQAGAS